MNLLIRALENMHYIKDHIGNVCAVVNSAVDTTIQSTIYYPSGVPMAKSLGRNVSASQYNAMGIQETMNFGLDEQPYLYNGKEYITAHDLNEYDSKARRYYATIMRTTTMDPLAEKYYSISPYAWCLNNPIKYMDPDGRRIVGETTEDKRINKRYHRVVNSRARSAGKQVDTIKKKLEKNPRNRDALLVKLAKAEQKLDTYQQIQRELAALENSPTIFYIRKSKDGWGRTTRDPETEYVYINITYDDEDQALMSVAHELCHGYQYLDGRLDFSEDGEYGGELYDYTDELEAYHRQNLFNPSLEGYSEEEIDKKTEKYLQDNYGELYEHRKDPRPAPIVDIRPEVLIYRPEEDIPL